MPGSLVAEVAGLRPEWQTFGHILSSLVASSSPLPFPAPLSITFHYYEPATPYVIYLEAYVSPGKEGSCGASSHPRVVPRHETKRPGLQRLGKMEKVSALEASKKPASCAERVIKRMNSR